MYRVILSFIKGEVSLVITFWFFCVFVLIFLEFLISSIALPSLLTLPYGKTILFILASIIAVYSIISLIAVWNSASKYTGLAIWKWLAKAVVVLNILLFAYTQIFPEKNIDQKIEAWNSVLPYAIDDNTTIDRIYIINKTINISYTLTGIPISEILYSKMQEGLSPGLIKYTCNHSLLKLSLESGYVVTHTYKANDVRVSREFSVKLEDCTNSTTTSRS